MGWLIRCIAILLALITALPARSDDQEKAQKQTSKIAAMAMDLTGRRMVSMSVSDVLNVSRPDLLRQRRQLGVDYGGLVVARHLILKGARLDDLTLEIKKGKSIYKIADERGADWKEIADQAKKVNSKIDSNLFKHFLNDKYYEANKARDDADQYNANVDIVQADLQVNEKDMEEAASRYQFLKEHAEADRPKDQRLDTSKRNAAYRDNVRSWPQQGSMGAPPPAAGGIPPQ